MHAIPKRGAGYPRCAACNRREGLLLCDYPVTTGAGGKCNKRLCAHCATAQRPNIHYCPAHQRLEASKPRPPVKVAACRACGCTDEDCRQCIRKTGWACHWVEVDLCSACVEQERSA